MRYEFDNYDNLCLFSTLRPGEQVETIATAILRNEAGSPETIRTRILQISDLCDLPVHAVQAQIVNTINLIANIGIETVGLAVQPEREV